MLLISFHVPFSRTDMLTNCNADRKRQMISSVKYVCVSAVFQSKYLSGGELFWFQLLIFEAIKHADVHLPGSFIQLYFGCIVFIFIELFVAL